MTFTDQIVQDFGRFVGQYPEAILGAGQLSAEIQRERTYSGDFVDKRDVGRSRWDRYNARYERRRYGSQGAVVTLGSIPESIQVQAGADQAFNVPAGRFVGDQRQFIAYADALDGFSVDVGVTPEVWEEKLKYLADTEQPRNVQPLRNPIGHTEEEAAVLGEHVQIQIELPTGGQSITLIGKPQ